MARAVDVGVVAFVGLILDVGHGDRDRLRGVAHRPALGDVGIGLNLRHALGILDRQDGASQRGFAVINVADRADIDVRFGPSEYFLSHCLCYSPCVGSSGSVKGMWTVVSSTLKSSTARQKELLKGIGPLTSSLPRTRSTG